MDPRITNKKNNLNKLSFTLSNLDISIANSIRRTMLSDIDLVVFETTPYENNKANIKINTSRLNNEVLKQRLSLFLFILQIEKCQYKIMLWN